MRPLQLECSPKLTKRGGYGGQLSPKRGGYGGQLSPKLSPKLSPVIAKNKMDKHYEYFLTDDIGTNLGFSPHLTPAEMLELGVFEGKYINDCKNEFPAEWFENAERAHTLSSKPDINCNYFKVKSRQSLSVWREKGWIYGPDNRGWFQWYCRYYMGRRIPEIDAIQIKRWKAFKRHYAQVQKNCPKDITCRPKQRQALLQWAYNPFV